MLVCEVCLFTACTAFSTPSPGGQGQRCLHLNPGVVLGKAIKHTKPLFTSCKTIQDRGLLPKVLCNGF